MEPSIAQPAATFDAPGAPPRLGAVASWMIAAGLVLAAAGFAAAVALGLAGAQSQRLFFHAYLVAFALFLSITLGALFFVLLQHLCRAGWSVSVRRLAEGLSGNIWLMAVLAAPLLVGMGQIYEWSLPGAAADDPALAAKAAYLNPAWFTARLAGYFVVWGILVWLLRDRSIRQDATADQRLTLAMERISAPGMLIFSFTVMFAAVDLLMSISPHWSSAIFGLYFFTGCVLSSLAVLALLAVWLRGGGPLGQAITVEHLHDLGKLLFAFVVFWGYIAFSQYLLIWYANLPEETQYFLPRQIGPWIWVSLGLVMVQLVVPFFGLLPRWAKRRPAVLAFWAVWLLAARVWDLFWLVMPGVFVPEMARAVDKPAGTPLPEVLRELLVSNQEIYEVSAGYSDFIQTMELPLEPRSLVVLLALIVGMGGLYLASTAWLLRGAALLPVGDPRLGESLTYENE